MGFKVEVFARVGEWLVDWFGSTSTLDIGQSENKTTEVEYVGGPFDGLIQEVDSSELWQLPVIVEVPFSRQQLDLLAGRLSANPEPPKSIAGYLLDCTAPRWYYRFERQTAASESAVASLSDGIINVRQR